MAKIVVSREQAKELLLKGVTLKTKYWDFTQDEASCAEGDIYFSCENIEEMLDEIEGCVVDWESILYEE